LVIDQFPAFELDGYTKRTGLSGGDFDITVFKDSVVDPLAATIAEIGTTGEYKLEYTPPGSGRWEVQVLIDFNKHIWVSEVMAGVDLYDLDDQLELVKDGGTGLFDDSSDSLHHIRGELSSVQGDISVVQGDLSRVLGLLHENTIIDNQQYDTFKQVTYARIRVFDSPGNVPATPGGDETTGLLYVYEMRAEYADINVVRRFALKRVS